MDRKKSHFNANAAIIMHTLHDFEEYMMPIFLGFKVLRLQVPQNKIYYKSGIHNLTHHPDLQLMQFKWVQIWNKWVHKLVDQDNP